MAKSRKKHPIFTPFEVKNKIKPRKGNEKRVVNNA